MMWFILILVALWLIPFSMEWTRTRMDDDARAAAPGDLVLLSQGTTHFQWLGPERGPTVLCVHGLTTPSFVWRGLAKGLALMGYRVLVYDHYGRGYSDTVAGNQDATFFLTQIDDLLGHLAVEEPITVIGYSMGGAIAAHFAAKYQSMVKQLILLAPAGFHIPRGRGLKLARDVPVLGDWYFLLTYPWMLRKGIKAEENQPSSVDGIHDLMRAETDRRGYFPAVLSSLRGVLRVPLETEHHAIATSGVPVLAVWGEHDDLIPLDATDTLATWNPQSTNVIIADAGHGITYTHTDAVLAAIKESLA